MTIKTEKSIFDSPDASDGTRVLVMRLWPRGISKRQVDCWMKGLGTEKGLIRTWKEGRLTWDEYSRLYLNSLKGNEDLLRELALEAKKGTVTFLCSCRDETHCHRHLLKRAVESVRL